MMPAFRVMPKGNLVVEITDVAGAPVAGRIEVELTRLSGEPGTGGESLRTSVAGSVTDLTLTGVTCRGGPGTTYRVRVTAPHYRPYAFFQLVQEDRDNTANDDVELWVKPGDVTGIKPSAFADLPAHVREILDAASMLAVDPEDQDLLGESGQRLYTRMGPLRQACFLNIVTKAAHDATAANCLPFVDGLLLCRQDRFFARVKATLPKHLSDSPRFKSAPDTLHEPLPGYTKAEHPSMKSRDAHANLQVTFMRHATTGALAADIDIDESSGIKHGLEVIQNAVFKSRTNPYLIREFLLVADPVDRSLDPGYDFVF